MTKAWKIFRFYKGELLSVIVRGKAVVKYTPGVITSSPEWLQKEGYYPTVFDSFENAMNFCVVNFQGPPVAIAEVEVGEEVPLLMRCDPWDVNRGKLRAINFAEWPPGTRMVKWVKVPEDFDLSKFKERT